VGYRTTYIVLHRCITQSISLCKNNTFIFLGVFPNKKGGAVKPRKGMALRQMQILGVQALNDSPKGVGNLTTHEE
jgi:hypothetical protein